MASFPRRVDLALLGAFEALPQPIRRAIARPTAGTFERLVQRYPANTWLPQLAVSLRWAAGPPERAAELCRRLGTSPRTAARARRQLARLSLRYGLTVTACFSQARPNCCRPMPCSILRRRGLHRSWCLHPCCGR